MPDVTSLDSDRRGTAALEFALVAPILILLIAAVITFGIAFGIQVAVTEAASEGARASLGGLTTQDRAQAAVTAACAALQGYSPLVITSQTTIMVTGAGAPVTCASPAVATTPATGTTTQVTVTYVAFKNFFPGFLTLNYTPTASDVVTNN